MEKDLQDTTFYYPGADWSVPTLYFWKLSDLIWLIPCGSVSLYLSFGRGWITPLALTLAVLFLRIGNGRATLWSMLRDRVRFLLRQGKKKTPASKGHPVTNLKKKSITAARKKKQSLPEAAEKTKIENSFWFERRTG